MKTRSRIVAVAIATLVSTPLVLSTAWLASVEVSVALALLFGGVALSFVYLFAVIREG